MYSTFKIGAGVLGWTPSFYRHISEDNKKKIKTIKIFKMVFFSGITHTDNEPKSEISATFVKVLVVCLNIRNQTLE